MKPSPVVALPSWNDCAAKQAILDFVRRVTSHGESDYVPENERIAVFDNDGTLWSEQPLFNCSLLSTPQKSALPSARN